MDSIVTNMAYSQFYAVIYAETLKATLETDTTTKALKHDIESALPSFYATVIVFSVKAKSYFEESGVHVIF